jgi:hypothetical protein
MKMWEATDGIDITALLEAKFAIIEELEHNIGNLRYQYRQVRTTKTLVYHTAFT